MSVFASYEVLCCLSDVEADDTALYILAGVIDGFISSCSNSNHHLILTTPTQPTMISQHRGHAPSPRARQVILSRCIQAIQRLVQSNNRPAGQISH